MSVQINASRQFPPGGGEVAMETLDRRRKEQWE